MIAEVFDDHVAIVFEGDAEISKRLLKLPFDHVFFTGSSAIGKTIMAAAAEHLTSVTLELGGKSPTIVTTSANIRDAAQRIAVGKFVNNGQTCIAPDYLLIDSKIADSFIKELITQLQTLFAGNGSFQNSESYARIVNKKHFTRLDNLLHDALGKGARLVFGGENDLLSNFFHPAILSDIPADAKLWEEEIFGPVLPIVTYADIDEAISFVNSKPKPLALYVFTRDKKLTDMILNTTSSGAVCINDCAIHFLNHNLPFGGVNNSGIGKSHGHHGFLTFSHEKSVMTQRSGLTTLRPFYPPYTNIKKKMMNWFLKLF
jgi:aldehyde dehydrogenase (NAD+)